MLIEKVYSTIVKYNMINEGDRILVGFSGGADSLFLIHSLIELKKRINIEIYASHVNHGIRGDEAKKDENFVREYCLKHNILLYNKNVDIPEISEKNKISEETAGRNERYKFFKEVCQKNNINKIAVAHNMNDSVETVIHNMIRGASLNGLCGIKPVYKNIIRPIIEVTRQEIELYLKENDLTYCTDSTNACDIYTRNKIRNNILKCMSEINPSVVQTVYLNSINLRNDELFISEYAKSLNCVSYDGADIVIDRSIFSNQHISVKSRIIMHAFEMLKGNCEGISGNHVEIIINATDSGRVYNMPNGVNVCISFDKIVFMNSDKRSSWFEYNYKIGEKLEYLPGLFLESSYCDKYNSDDKNCLFVDAELLNNSVLKIRSRLDGDKFIPFGMTSQKKIKKYFTELKIPAYKRNEIPLILDGDQVVCVVPYRISELYKTSKETKKVVKFKITKEK